MEATKEVGKNPAGAQSRLSGKLYVLPGNEMRKDCGRIFEPVTLDELEKMTQKQRDFLATWG